MRKRTRARELVVKVLYQVDVGGMKGLADSEVARALAEAQADEQVAAFARELLKGIWEQRETIDRRIEEVSHNWKLDRMALIDRNIIRLGAFELMFRDDVPALVSINEAIEIAKKFSTRKSGSFVNGVLDSLRKKYAAHKPCGGGGGGVSGGAGGGGVGHGGGGGWEGAQQPEQRQKPVARGS